MHAACSGGVSATYRQWDFRVADHSFLLRVGGPVHIGRPHHQPVCVVTLLVKRSRDLCLMQEQCGMPSSYGAPASFMRNTGTNHQQLDSTPQVAVPFCGLSAKSLPGQRLATLPWPAASSYHRPFGQCQDSYRGLPPHKFNPMAGVPNALNLDVQKFCVAPLSFAGYRGRSGGSTSSIRGKYDDGKVSIYFCHTISFYWRMFQ